MTDLLEPADLEAFERQLAALDVPVVRYLRPGRSASELDAAETRFGFALPLEARVWFGWHDGVGRAAHPPEQTLGGLELLSLDEAIDRSKQNREIALESVDGDGELADGDWRSGWLTIGVPVYALDVAIDCSGAHIDAVPVHIVDWQDLEQASVPRCASLKELVERGAEVWIGELEVEPRNAPLGRALATPRRRRHRPSRRQLN